MTATATATALMLMLVMLMLAAAAAAPPAKYDSRFDHMDVDAVLGNQRVLDGFIKCILETGPCTPEGREFRKHLPEALKTNCAKCTDAQKALVRKLALHVRQHQPAQWQLIRNKYDPHHQYSESFSKFLTAAA